VREQLGGKAVPRLRKLLAAPGAFVLMATGIYLNYWYAASGYFANVGSTFLAGGGLFWFWWGLAPHSLSSQQR
jgi:hypothetical protein